MTFGTEKNCDLGIIRTLLPFQGAYFIPTSHRGFALRLTVLVYSSGFRNSISNPLDFEATGYLLKANGGIKDSKATPSAHIFAPVTSKEIPRAGPHWADFEANLREQRQVLPAFLRALCGEL